MDGHHIDLGCRGFHLQLVDECCVVRLHCRHLGRACDIVRSGVNKDGSRTTRLVGACGSPCGIHFLAGSGDVSAVVPARAAVLDIGVTQQLPPFGCLDFGIAEYHDVVAADGHHREHGGTSSVHTGETVLTLNGGEVSVDIVIHTCDIFAQIGQDGMTPYLIGGGIGVEVVIAPGTAVSQILQCVVDIYEGEEGIVRRVDVVLQDLVVVQPRCPHTIAGVVVQNRVQVDVCAWRTPVDAIHHALDIAEHLLGSEVEAAAGSDVVCANHQEHFGRSVGNVALNVLTLLRRVGTRIAAVADGKVVAVGITEHLLPDMQSVMLLPIIRMLPALGDNTLKPS